MMKDTAIRILAKVHADKKLQIPLSLVEKCYEVEKQFLFEKDRDKPLELIRAAVEEYVTETNPNKE